MEIQYRGVRPPNTITVQQAARLVGRTGRAVRYAIETGAVRAYKVGHHRTGTWFIEPDTLENAFPTRLQGTGKRVWRYLRPDDLTITTIGESNAEAEAEGQHWSDAADAVKRAIEEARG